MKYKSQDELFEEFKQSAIKSWKRASKGNINWWNSYAEGYDEEYCLKQVEYFKKLER